MLNQKQAKKSDAIAAASRRASKKPPGVSRGASLPLMKNDQATLVVM
jgi:hypothetical protein